MKLCPFTDGLGVESTCPFLAPLPEEYKFLKLNH